MFLIILKRFLLPVRKRDILIIMGHLVCMFRVPLFMFISNCFTGGVCGGKRCGFGGVLCLVGTCVVFIVTVRVMCTLYKFQSFSRVGFFSRDKTP